MRFGADFLAYDRGAGTMKIYLSNGRSNPSMRWNAETKADCPRRDGSFGVHAESHSHLLAI